MFWIPFISWIFYRFKGKKQNRKTLREFRDMNLNTKSRKGNIK